MHIIMMGWLYSGGWINIVVDVESVWYGVGFNDL